MHLNSLKRQLLLCFTVITPHLLSELYWVTDGFSYGSTAQVLVIKITHLHMIYTPHFHLFWAFIRHLSIICQSKTKKEWGFPNLHWKHSVPEEWSDAIYGSKATISEKSFSQLGFIRPSWITAAFLVQVFISGEKFLPSKSFLWMMEFCCLLLVFYYLVSVFLQVKTEKLLL